MVVKIDRKKAKELLESYYKEVLDIDGKITIGLTKDYVGNGMSESLSCVLKIKLKGKMKLAGEETPISIDVDEETLKEAVKYAFEKDGHEVKHVRLDKGLTTKTKGPGLAGYNERNPYFRGVEISINNFVKKKGVKENGTN